MQVVFFELRPSFRHTHNTVRAMFLDGSSGSVKSIFLRTNALQATKPLELAYNRSYLTQLQYRGRGFHASLLHSGAGHSTLGVHTEFNRTSRASWRTRRLAAGCGQTGSHQGTR